MAYVHCHTKDCNWSQDDFWSWKGYNPFRFFMKNDFPYYIRPRFLGTDPTCVGKSRIARALGLVGVREIPWPYNDGKAVSMSGEVPKTVHESYEHSWYTLWRCSRSVCRRLITQKWWTYKAWRKAVDNGRGGCPKCGKGLCID